MVNVPKKITLHDILKFLKNTVIEVVGSKEKIINKPVPLDESENEQNITFCDLTGKQAVGLVSQTKAGVILCSKNLIQTSIELGNKTLIVVEEPRLSFIRIVNAFFIPPKPNGIHPTSVISPDAEIARDVYVGPLTYVGNCKIGEGSVIYGNSYIYDNTKIGKNVVIHAGTVIGSDGFGYQRNENGVLEKFGHIGGVVIEDDVEIGSNTCIDKGTLGNTIIKEGTKIDNCVYIAHNVVIGKHTIIVAHAIICGSVTIGNESWISPGACVRDKVSVGNKTTLGLGAVATEDVPDKIVVMGVPAKPVKRHQKYGSQNI